MRSFMTFNAPIVTRMIGLRRMKSKRRRKIRKRGMSMEFQLEPAWKTYIHVSSPVLTTGVRRMWTGFIWLRIGTIGRRL
jgi:hypothetical protein